MIRGGLILAGLAFAFAVITGLALVQSGLEPASRPRREPHDWYRGLQQPGSGMSCCNAQTADSPEGDCRPASVWRDADGRVYWGRQLVPPGVVLKDSLNRQPLSGHICEKNGFIYCALVGGAGG